MDIAATLEAFIDKVDLLYLTDVIGIVAFAFAGVLIGIRMKCDPVGIFVLAFSTAFGGGIMRDLLTVVRCTGLPIKSSFGWCS